MPVSEKTFRQVALEDPEGQWELYCGSLRRKPGMSIEHNWFMSQVAFTLMLQLDGTEFDVRSNVGHVHLATQSYHIPDVFVIPTALQQALWGTRKLEWYSEPLPLVVEVWSPSTGDYDVETKLHEYQKRGDREIWRLHPYEQTLIAWRRQPDGSYTETVYRGGAVQPVALANVAVDLDRLFALARVRGASADTESQLVRMLPWITAGQYPAPPAASAPGRAGRGRG